MSTYQITATLNSGAAQTHTRTLPELLIHIKQLDRLTTVKTVVIVRIE